MAKMYELRKLWGIGPFRRRKVIGTFDSLYVARHVMTVKLLRARKRGKRLELELIENDTGKVVKKAKSR